MLAQPRLAAVIILAILSAGCASSNPNHDDKTSLSPATATGAPSTKTLPPEWTTTYWGLAASVRCDDTDNPPPENDGVTNRNDDQTYSLPSGDSLANATTLHLTVAWNVAIPVQSIRFGLNGLVNGTTSSGSGEAQIAATQLKPGASYPFFACAKAPAPLLVNPLAVDEITARVWYTKD